jgi:hypothetical protein
LCQFSCHRVHTDFVQLVERDKGISMMRRRDTCRAEERRQELPMVDPDHEVGEAESGQRIRPGRAHLGFDHRRGRTERIDVALIELAEPPRAGRSARQTGWI